MSTTIDQSVVEMRFDNKQFESGVSTTMSSIDKLKQKLQFKDSSKGLENVSNAARKVDMNGLGSGVEAVRMKFSALQVMAVTALSNITNSAVNAGKRIVSALTIDPVRTGLSEYETKINAIQVIKANTRGKYDSEAAQMEAITAALDELNDYADRTIYNYAQMTSNVGKFVAQGLNAEQASKAVQGMANLAAASGASAEDMARATYQMSQALGGVIRMQDWRSLMTANMATTDLKNTLIALAKVNGVAIDDMIKKHGTFEQTLSKGWLTGEMFTKAMNIYSGVYSDDDLRKMGFNDDQVANFKDLAKSAAEAATEVKTLTQLWSVLKETAQSGWTRTWEIIVGDFNQAKKMFTDLQNYFSGIINGWSEARNFVLGAVANITDPWKAITEKLDAAGLGKIKEVAKSVSDAADKVKYFQDVVTKVWRGDYNNRGDDPDRYDLLTKAGYDPRVVQTLVNKGYDYKLTIEDIEEAHKKCGVTMDKTSDATKELTKDVVKLTDKQLEEAGLTEQEISLYRALEEEADRLGISLEELVDTMSKKDGRTLMIESIKNAWDGFLGILKSIKTAFGEIFDVPTSGELIVKLYGIITSINKFSEKLRLTDKDTGKLNETGEKFVRIFKGVFAILDIILTVIGGPVKIIIGMITDLLDVFGVGILDIAAYIGDAAVKFRDWIDGALDFKAIFEKIVPPIVDAVTAIKDWINSLKESEDLPRDIAEGIVKGLGAACEFIGKIFKNLWDIIVGVFTGETDGPLGPLIKGLRRGIGLVGEVITEIGLILLEKFNGVLSKLGFKEISVDAISGFIDGIKDGIGGVLKTIGEFAQKIIDKVKEIFQIHSPSKVFFAIGGFIIAGLLAGLTNAFPGLSEFFKDLGGSITDALSGINWPMISKSIIGIGAVSVAGKVATAIKNFSKPFGEIGNLIDVIKDQAKNLGKALAFKLRMDAISNMISTIAKSLLMLVAVVAILTFFDPKELWSATGIVVVLAAVLIGLAFALDKMSSTTVGLDKEGAKIEGLQKSLFPIVLAILGMAIAVKMIGKLSPEECERGLLGFATIVVAMIALVAIFSKMSVTADNEGVSKIGGTLLKISLALGIMAIVIKLLGKLDRSVLEQGLTAIAAFALIIVGLMAATKLISGSKNVDTIGGTILKIAGAFALMAIVVRVLSELEPSQIRKGVIAIAAFGLIIVGLMAATKLISGSKNVEKIGTSILAIAAAIAIMAIIVRLLSGMDPSQIRKGVVAVAAFGLIIVGLMAATKLVSGSKNVDKIGLTILAVSGAIAILAATAFLLSLMKKEAFIKALTMITIFGGIVVALMAAAKLLANDTKMVGTLLSMAAAIAILALVAVLLGQVDTNKLAQGVIAVAAIGAVMALLIFATKSAKNCIGNILAITIAIAAIAGVVYLLSTMPVESVIGSAIALGGLLLVMTGVLLALTVVGKMATDAILGTIALTLMAVPLLAFVGVLAVMANVQNAMTNVMALVLLVGALTLLMLPLMLVGALWMPALIGLGALTLMAVPMLAFVGVLALMNKVENAAANIYLLIDMMGSMASLLIVMAPIAPLALIAVTALTMLTGLVITMGLLAVAIGALMTEYPQLQSFIDAGLPVLEQLAEGLGRMIGKFVAAFTGEVMTVLPELGRCLSEFMDNAYGFIEGSKNIDAKVLFGVSIITAAIAALTTVELMAAITSFLTGSSFAELGTQLSDFMDSVGPFIEGSSSVTPKMVSGVAAIADAILILTKAGLREAIASFISGESSIETFAAQLPFLGIGLREFSKEIGVFGEDQIATVDCAAQAIKTLAEAAKTIPNSGGWWGAIAGENDLDNFATMFPVLGTGLRNFLTNVGVFTEEEVETVKCAAEAVKALAEAAKKIPNSGGWWGKIAGENDLDTFAAMFPKLGTGLTDFLANVGTFTEEQVAVVRCASDAVIALAEAAKEIPNSGGWWGAIAGENDLDSFAAMFPKLGTGLADFLINVGTFTEDQLATIKCGADAVSIFANVAKTIPNSGGWWGKIAGENDLGNFAEQFPKVGTGIKGFADELGTFSEDQVTTIRAGLDAIQVLGNLSNIDLDALTDNVGKFGDNVVGFGKDLAKFCDNLAKVSSSTITDAINKVKQLVDAIMSITGENATAAADFGESLQTLGVDGVKKFISAFDHSSRDVYSAGEKMIQKVIDGAETKMPTCTEMLTTLVTSMVNTLMGKYKSFLTAGDYLVQGFAAGISANTYKATAQARAMAKAAADAAEDELDINSPSKVFRKIGYSVPEGMAQGIDRLSWLVDDSAAAMGNTAISSVSKSISRIAEAVNTDIDSQPTIRPVLDLSDVRAGADSIGSMLNFGDSIGVTANIGAISSMMNQRSQNGANDDVISAINRLRDKMDNFGNTTYSINGVTYDDGSNISSAVETLVRAARIERRV